MDLDKLKHSYLTFIKIHIETQNPDNKLIRSFIDRWFAYKKQGNFLTKGNIERTFNRSDISPNNLQVVTKDCLLNMHFISKNALNAINSKSDTRLVKDHAVPVKIISEMLKQVNCPSEASVEKLLLSFYRLGVLTHEEDKTLNQFNLKSAMPNDWDGKNVFARYEKAGIQKADISV
jgi:hypothetical protein